MCPPGRQGDPRRTTIRRGGFAVLLVMSLLSIAFAVSFMVTRTQVSIQELQTNTDLGNLALQTAQTGFSAALAKIQSTAWGGVDTRITGSVNAWQTYSIDFTTGDESIASDDARQPYRVTCTITATANDRANSTRQAVKRQRVVMEFCPQATNTPPTTFTNSANFTVYQYTSAAFNVQFPGRLEGPVRFLGTLAFADAYNFSATQREKYITDLNAMRQVGFADMRPLPGPVSFPMSGTSSTIINRLTTQQGATTINIPSTNDTGFNFPGLLTTYRLYPGGKVYTAQTLPSLVKNATYQPNMATNPLGLFYSSGSVSICDNATIRGTIMTNGSVTICGNPCAILPADLPPLDGTSEPVRLPTILSKDDIYIQDPARATVRGVVAAWDTFDIQNGQASTTLDLQGRVISKAFYLRPRNSWPNGSALYNIYWTLYQSQLSPPSESTIVHWPVYLSLFGPDPTPRIFVKSDTDPARYAWKDSSNPVFVAPTAGSGLRWKVVSVVDYE